MLSVVADIQVIAAAVQAVVKVFRAEAAEVDFQVGAVLPADFLAVARVFHAAA
jgi:hypothetical protein